MPTYDYRCAKCGDDLEVYQTFSEEPLKKHAGCGGKLTKVFSPVGIVLKGSGFYRNDKRDSGTARSKPREEISTNGDSTSSSGDSSTPAPTSEKAGGESKPGEKAGGESKPNEKQNGARKNGDRKSDEKKSPVKSG